MRPERFKSLAYTLRRRLDSDPTMKLPSANALAAEFGVAASTAWKAIRVCNELGKALGKASLPTPPDPATALYEKLKTALQQSDIGVGEMLPKFESLAASHRLSRTTIAHALRQLSSDRLIHKRGKCWIAGPQPSTTVPAQSARGLTRMVLILCTDTQQNVFHNLLVQPFWETLKYELHPKDIQFRLGYRIPEEVRTPIRCQGIEEMGESIRSWGDFFRGTIIYDQHMDRETLAQWARLLSMGGTRPVIYFDLSNSNPSFTRSGLSLGHWYYRVHFDEPAAVAVALGHLFRAGHRVVGLPTMPWDTNEWVARRIGLIKKTAKAFSPTPEILSVSLNEPFWDPATPFSIERKGMSSAITDYVALQRASWSTSRPRTNVSDVVRATPSMAKLCDKGVTAIVALNDWLAHQIFVWCHLAGIDIPRDMSIVSFDNDPVATTYSISTIDFGYARLGYLTARLLCGSRLAEADREGAIPSVPTIVNHGSVAERLGRPQKLPVLIRK